MYNVSEFSKRFNTYILTQPVDQGGAQLDKLKLEKLNLVALIPILVFQIAFSKRLSSEGF